MLVGTLGGNQDEANPFCFPLILAFPSYLCHFPSPSKEGTSTSTADADGSGSGGGGWFSGLFTQLTGNKVLEREDIEPAIESFKEHLASKNVAADVADNICESVATRVEGKKLPSLTRVSTVVYEALEVAVTRLLTPNRDVGPLSASCCMGPKRGFGGGGGLG